MTDNDKSEPKSLDERIAEYEEWLTAHPTKHLDTMGLLATMLIADRQFLKAKLEELLRFLKGELGVSKGYYDQVQRLQQEKLLLKGFLKERIQDESENYAINAKSAGANTSMSGMIIGAREAYQEILDFILGDDHA